MMKGVKRSQGKEHFDFLSQLWHAWKCYETWKTASVHNNPNSNNTDVAYGPMPSLTKEISDVWLNVVLFLFFFFARR